MIPMAQVGEEDRKRRPRFIKPASLWQKTLLLALLLWPWLNPFAPGPSPQVLPLLISWGCLAGVLAFWSVLSARQIALGWLLAGLLSTVIALCQYFGVASAFAPWMSLTDPGNVYANLRQRNQFASLTGIALAAAIWFVLHTKDKPQNQRLLVLAAVLLGLGNALSASRTGLVQFICLSSLAALWPIWRTRQVVQVLLLAWAAYLFGSLVLPYLNLSSALHQGIFSRFVVENPSCASRRVLWANVLDLISLKPWLGWGWGELDYAQFATLFEGTRYCEIADNAHNLPLHLAVELGVPLALLACGGLTFAVARAKAWREANLQRQMAWAVLLVIGLHSLLEYPLWYGSFQMAVVMCLWLLWHHRPANAVSVSHSAALTTPITTPLAGPVSVQIHHSATPQLSGWRNLLASLVLLAVIFIAWDYQRVSQIYLVSADRMPNYRSDTLNKIRDTRFFKAQAQFAELTLTPLTSDNAAYLNVMAHQLLHFSPEARVIKQLIDSAALLGKQDEVAFYRLRFEAAFPEAYQQWLATQPKSPPPQ